MGFADWKKRSKRYKEINESLRGWGQRGLLLELCQAAYKAGERDGRKQVDDVAEQAIALRELMRSNAKSQATDAALSRQVRWTAGLCNNTKETRND